MGAYYGFANVLFLFFSFSFSRSRSVPEKSALLFCLTLKDKIPTLPEKEGPSTFACKSKNTSGRIGIFLSRFQILTQKYQSPDSKKFPFRVSGRRYEIGPVCLSVRLSDRLSVCERSHCWTVWFTVPKFGGIDQTWAEAGFGFTKPAFLGSRVRLPRFLRAWLWLRDFQRLRLRGLPKLLLCKPKICILLWCFSFADKCSPLICFVTKASASASKLIRVKASASKFVKASTSWLPGFGPCLALTLIISWRNPRSRSKVIVARLKNVIFGFSGSPVQVRFVMS